MLLDTGTRYGMDRHKEKMCVFYDPKDESRSADETKLGLCDFVSVVFGTRTGSRLLCMHFYIACPCPLRHASL
jgi:hypothetical protein